MAKIIIPAPSLSNETKRKARPGQTKGIAIAKSQKRPAADISTQTIGANTKENTITSDIKTKTAIPETQKKQSTIANACRNPGNLKMPGGRKKQPQQHKNTFI